MDKNLSATTACSTLPQCWLQAVALLLWYREKQHCIQMDSLENQMKIGRCFAEKHGYMEAELQRCVARNRKVAELFEKLYEDNVEGEVTDEWFMQLSHKYEVERMELKSKIVDLQNGLDALKLSQQRKDQFIRAIRKFMDMQTLTAPLLRELIDHIDVHETQGTGKNRTQRLMIHYKFIGYIEIPECGSNYTADTRQGVAVEYITQSA